MGRKGWPGAALTGNPAREGRTARPAGVRPVARPAAAAACGGSEGGRERRPHRPALGLGDFWLGGMEHGRDVLFEGLEKRVKAGVRSPGLPCGTRPVICNPVASPLRCSQRRLVLRSSASIGITDVPFSPSSCRGNAVPLSPSSCKPWVSYSSKTGQKDMMVGFKLI